MRNLWARFKAHFQTGRQKLGGLLVFIPLLKDLWGWARTMIDTLGRVDTVWQIWNAARLSQVLGMLGVVAAVCGGFLFSGVGTLVIVVIGFALILFGGSTQKEVAVSGPIAESPRPLADDFALARSVHVNSIVVGFEHLLDDGVLTLTIDAFTGALNPISVDRHVEGVIRLLWGDADKAPDKDLLLAIAPQIDPVSSRLEQIPRCTPFQIRLTQPVS